MKTTDKEPIQTEATASTIEYGLTSKELCRRIVLRQKLQDIARELREKYIE
jgi:hypothetical protein